MRKMFRGIIAGMLAVLLCAGILTGCGKKAEPVASTAEKTEPKNAVPEKTEPEDFLPEDTEEYYDDEEFEEYEDYEDFENYEDLEEEPEEITEEHSRPDANAAGSKNLSNEEIVELAKKHSGAPVAVLDQVMDNGNLYIHLYEDMEDHTATIDWYEIDPKTLKGTNFMGEEVDLSDGASSAAAPSDSEGDAGEGVAIADGEYVTDEEYEGELSADGKTLTITTALSEFVNSPSPSYPKQTYVITVADSCKCVEVQEETKVSSFFDKMDLINDFLEGKNGLPITLKFKNNELIEILFTS